ncbi:SGNH hydrolase-type esterase domain-containing protein [Mycena belliarum]|uniref:SGNH hydrolase-type esterase domain-containing protein n=1 Tax=Mycena belliarum TaxID=1033014 RepID=A0AAD6XT03_9AGAR|nr:SGNH hydrolase-type esterase domain-containing protein [Mycena belliae]
MKTVWGLFKARDSSLAGARDDSKLAADSDSPRPESLSASNGSQNTSLNTSTSPWPGFPALKDLFIFGDSYSAIGSASAVDWSRSRGGKHRELPFKGETYADADGTNWVGYLLAEHRDAELRVHGYAEGGARVSAVEAQVGAFLGGTAKPWDPARSLFVTWVGINDCAYAETHAETVGRLFHLEERLYAAGARLFLFIDVPPIGRSPAGMRASSDISATYTNWNDTLRSAVAAFAGAHPAARVLTFSASDTFTRVLDDPGRHGFAEADVSAAGGAMWRDHLHPTSRVHRILARDIAAFLTSVSLR